jgi:hypothetical protein
MRGKNLPCTERRRILWMTLVATEFHFVRGDFPDDERQHFTDVARHYTRRLLISVDIPSLT